MKVIKGKHLLSNDIHIDDDEIIINFSEKRTFVGLSQTKDKLTLKTTDGDVIISFWDDNHVFEIDYYEKDQLVLQRFNKLVASLYNSYCELKGSSDDTKKNSFKELLKESKELNDIGDRKWLRKFRHEPEIVKLLNL